MLFLLLCIGNSTSLFGFSKVPYDLIAGKLREAHRLNKSGETDALENEVAIIVDQCIDHGDYPTALDSGRSILYTHYLRKEDFQSLEMRLEEDIEFVRENFKRFSAVESRLRLDNLIIYQGYAAGRRGDYLRRKEINEHLYHEISNRPVPDTVQLASLTTRLATDYIAMGDYVVAIDYAERGRRHWLSLSARSRNAMSPYLGSLLSKYMGDAHRLNGNYVEADLAYKRALRQLPDSIWRLNSQYRSRVVVSYHGLGRSAMDREFFDNGRYYLNEAEIIEKQYGGVSSLTLYLQGVLERKAGRPREAERLLREALIGYASNFVNYRRGKVHLELGRVYADIGRTEEALDQFQLSLHNLVPGFTDEDWSENPTELDRAYPQLDLLATLREKAKALGVSATGDRKRLEIALETHTLAVNTLDMIKGGLDSELIRSQRIAENYKLFEEGIELAKMLGRDDVALELAEQSHSNRLLSAVLATRLPENLLPEIKRREELDIKSRLASAQRSIARAASKGASPAIFLDDAAKARLDLVDFYNDLKQDNKEYYQLLRDVKSNDYKSMKAGVDGEEVMVSFFVGEKTSYGFLLQPGKEVFVYPINITQQRLATLITELLRGIYFGRPEENTLVVKSSGRVPHSKEEADGLFADRAYHLYDLLLRPVTDKLGEHKRRLLIVPHEVLSYLPFDVLLQAEVPEAEIGLYGNSTYRFIARDYRTSYAYSATLHQLMKNGITPDKQHGALLFHDVDFSTQRASVVEAFADAGFGTEFVEVLDQAGSVQALVDKGKSYQLIHFSVHGVVNGNDPAFSYLKLRPEGVKDNSDSLLSLSRLYALDLPVELVFTSACNAGVGNLYDGEGVLSLARGFAHAGAKSLVTTLWAVTGGASNALMTDFYRELGAGARKDEALYTAKRRMLERTEYAHPYYWAGFIPVGDMAPLGGEASSSYWLWCLVAGVVMVGGLIWLWRKF